MTETSLAKEQDNANSDLFAIVWVLVSTALFTLVYASAKLTGGTVPALTILFMRYIGGIATLALLLFLRRESPQAYRSRQVPLHLLRSACGSYGGVAAIQAPVFIPLLDATAIGLLEGVFITALGIIFLRERLTWLRWLGASLSLAGAVIVVMGQGAFLSTATGDYAIGITLALGGAFLIGVESIFIKMLATSERPLSLLLHVNCFGILLLAGPALWVWPSDPAISPFAFLLLGPIAIAAQYTTIRGYALAQVALLAPIGYSWLLFAGALGWLIFAEVPTPLSLGGAFLMLLGGLALTRR